MPEVTSGYGGSVLHLLSRVPGSIAVIDGDRQIDCAELSKEVASWCQMLLGLESRSMSRWCPAPAPVAFVARNPRDSLILLWALFELQRPAFPLHPRWTQTERRLLVERVGAVELERDATGWKVTFCSSRTVGYEPSTAVLMATSGSSGIPKVVSLSARALRASAQASSAHLGWVKEDRWLLSLTLAHVGGLSIVVRCLLAGKPVVLAPLGLSSAELVEIVTRTKTTLVSLVPTQLERILTQCPEWDGKPVRAILVGGARANQELLSRARKRGIPVLATYGMTETASQIATQSLKEARDLSRCSDGAVVLPGAEVRCAQGLVWVRGPMLFEGYVGEATSPGDQQGWFCSGDTGFLDSQGRLHIHGRREDRIVTGGENVSPAEVEKVLESCPGVLVACVFGVPDPEWGELVAAVVVLDSTAVLSFPELAQFWKGRLASYKEPRRLAFVPHLEVGPSGKVDRRATARGWRDLLKPVPNDIPS